MHLQTQRKVEPFNVSAFRETSSFLGDLDSIVDLSIVMLSLISTVYNYEKILRNPAGSA